MAILVDTSQPLIVVTFEGAVDDDEFDRYLEALTANMQILGRYALILDASAAGRATMSQVRKQAAWMQAHAEYINTWSVGIAVVITSPVVQRVLSAIFWIEPLHHTPLITTTKAKAQSWCRARLQENPGPPQPRALAL